MHGPDDTRRALRAARERIAAFLPGECNEMNGRTTRAQAVVQRLVIEHDR